MVMWKRESSLESSDETWGLSFAIEFLLNLAGRTVPASRDSVYRPSGPEHYKRGEPQGRRDDNTSYYYVRIHKSIISQIPQAGGPSQGGPAQAGKVH